VNAFLAAMNENYAAWMSFVRARGVGDHVEEDARAQLDTFRKGFDQIPNSGGLPCLLRTSDHARMLWFCLRVMRVLVTDHALPDSRNQGVLEISRFLRRLFPSVRGFSDYAVRGHPVAFLLLGIKSAS
jgi:hypothetical protein